MHLERPFCLICLHFQKKMVFIVADYHKSYLERKKGKNKLILEAPEDVLVNVIKITFLLISKFYFCYRIIANK